MEHGRCRTSRWLSDHAARNEMVSVQDTFSMLVGIIGAGVRGIDRSLN